MANGPRRSSSSAAKRRGGSTSRTSPTIDSHDATRRTSRSASHTAAGVALSSMVLLNSANMALLHGWRPQLLKARGWKDERHIGGGTERRAPAPPDCGSRAYRPLTGDTRHTPHLPDLQT